ncbi:MAG: hypothetical protein M1546_04430 [Chloroflexi bacterium]|nr:hypothetical protein [Chloroflexota bacterium]
MKQDFAANWPAQADEVITGVQDWRLAHPKATLKEIEQAIDQHLAALRAHMLTDAAMASAAEVDPPRCPQCGDTMEWRGDHPRTLVTQHDRAVELKRHYAVCPTCGVGFFPPG